MQFAKLSIGQGWKPGYHLPFIHICCAMPVVINLLRQGRTPGRSSIILATRTSSILSDTLNYRQKDLKISGRINMDYTIFRGCIPSNTDSKELYDDNQKSIKTLLTVNFLTRH